MSQALLLVLQFLGEPSDSERAALSAYERARQVKLELRTRQPRVSRSQYPAYDAELVTRIETELDAARTSAASLDERGALDALARVEQVLREHPELPQAAWLMAERYRLGARVGSDSAEHRGQRERWEAQASALEGPRALEFGASTHAESHEPPVVNVRVEGLDERDTLELDGRSFGRSISTRAGEHHVRVLRGERLIFAGWVMLGEGATALVLRTPALVPCSEDDLARPGARCPRWAVATRAPGGLNIAECFADHCGPYTFYGGSAPEAALIPPPQPVREESSSTLLTVALGGAAVLATTFVILWQGGAFDSEPPPRQQWVYGGYRPAP